MRKSSNNTKLEQSAATLTALEAAKKRGIRRSRLTEEQIPDAMHFMTALLDGVSEVDYARRHPQTYARLRQAMER